ncbi:zf-C2H2_12 domain-containing protein [Caerostris extrusa]|uniref:Zf-C2H2_12 domain-containing protein n=1 Tax=Caerostris extrusa TaxID=172846 RepID=A0AAV4YF39_CAEEX|nr:zf-C2H2_12 domain-containing protein [Caerostris extrusa]
MTANRRIVDENRKHNEEWEEKYFFIVQKYKVIVLNLSKAVTVFKEYNVKRHYETKRKDYLKFDKIAKQLKLKEFKLQLKAQEKIFGAALQQPSNIVKASYSISFLFAKKR